MRISQRLWAAVAMGVLATLVLPGASSRAAERCLSVRGSYTERPIVGPECQSPVGLCIAATYRGDIVGEAFAQATSIVSTADTPSTSVQLFTSDTVIVGRVAGRSGDLIIKNAGAFGSTGDGPIVDLQTIVGGTGDLVGAGGALRAQGTFTFPDGGRSQYTGTVCFA